MQPPRRPEACDIGAAVSESRSWMGAGCSVDSWRLVAERGVSPPVVCLASSYLRQAHRRSGISRRSGDNDQFAGGHSSDNRSVVAWRDGRSDGAHALLPADISSGTVQSATAYRPPTRKRPTSDAVWALSCSAIHARRSSILGGGG